MRRTPEERRYDEHLKKISEALHRGENTRALQKQSILLYRKAKESRKTKVKG